MRVALTERAGGDVTVVLGVTLEASERWRRIGYETRTGALVRLDGRIAGAFDREHRDVLIAPIARAAELTIEVELESLPTNGLPPGPGLRWRLLTAGARATPSRTVDVAESAEPALARAVPPRDAVELWGHGHLDVAWLWTYEQTRRKAVRTFANALALLDADAAYTYVQSQPQLYAFVRENDSEFFERVRTAVRAGRFDCDVAALWVEPDCNVPSGESLLRQMLAAHRYCTDEFAMEPSIAWLPDTFGFARTLPTLLNHAGIRRFATTKLQWNDTTQFPHPQFRWRGPDGSEVIGASIDRMEGDCTPDRVRLARGRREPLIVGYGDGGGGPNRAQLAQAEGSGVWSRPREFFERLERDSERLPVHDDELYLQYHRGVYTTHHDVKAANAELERALELAEERAAWCVAVRAPSDGLARIRGALRAAWEIVLRNQFHDVLPGTSIAAVYDDVRAEYLRAFELVEAANTAAASMLPRAARPPAAPVLVAPTLHDGAYALDNGSVRAVVRPSGTLLRLRAPDAPNVVAQSNVLALYRDRPQKWEAWNVDDTYRKTRRAARPGAARIVDDGLEIPFDLGTSTATMRVTLVAGEPFVRADLAVDWRERRTLLRMEQWLAIEAGQVTYGAPHGIVVRSARADTPERRAQFEVPGQRFAAVWNAHGHGLATLALDTYGWSARALPKGGIALGHSLLRSTTWPDPLADRGTHALSWAFAPLRDRSIATIEGAWRIFAQSLGVRLFVPETPSVLVVACKPAEDGDGVVVRIRECDGAAATARLRCGGRMREAVAVDALERPCAGGARVEGESMTFGLGAFSLRSFRVRF